MTEEEWLVCDDPARMLRHLRGRACARRYRLFAISCARDELERAKNGQGCFNFGDALREEIIPIYWDPLKGYEAAILSAEADADGGESQPTACWWYISWAREEAGAYAALGYDPDGLVQVPLERIAATIRSYRTHPAHFLRDIFGNPFRPVAFSDSWRTDTAVSLARAMYDSRDFGAMSILADALQDAGCDNEELLNHCRDPKQAHVRGCWVVDLVLGKE